MISFWVFVKKVIRTSSLPPVSLSPPSLTPSVLPSRSPEELEHSLCLGTRSRLTSFLLYVLFSRGNWGLFSSVDSKDLEEPGYCVWYHLFDSYCAVHEHWNVDSFTVTICNTFQIFLYASETQGHWGSFQSWLRTHSWLAFSQVLYCVCGVMDYFHPFWMVAIFKCLPFCLSALSILSFLLIRCSLYISVV